MTRIAGTLNRVVVSVLEVCDPVAIMLFGSYAKDKATVESDIDLLVVAETDRAPMIANEIRQHLDQLPIPFDVLVVTPREVEAGEREARGFLASIVESGTLLYCQRGHLVEPLRRASIRSRMQAFGGT